MYSSVHILQAEGLYRPIYVLLLFNQFSTLVTVHISIDVQGVMYMVVVVVCLGYMFHSHHDIILGHL